MNTREPLHSFRTKTGLIICVRRLQVKDACYLVDVFDHMGPESRYQRFCRAIGNVSREQIWQEATEIAQLTANKGAGLIAFSALPGQGIVPLGVARYVETTSRTAEVAVSIRDDFQNMGIGTELMRLLAEMARENGFERLVGDMLSDNVTMWRVFQHLPYHATRTADGMYYQVALDLTMPTVVDNKKERPLSNVVA